MFLRNGSRAQYKNRYRNGKQLITIINCRRNSTLTGIKSNNSNFCDPDAKIWKRKVKVLADSIHLLLNPTLQNFQSRASSITSLSLLATGVSLIAAFSLAFRETGDDVSSSSSLCEPTPAGTASDLINKITENTSFLNQFLEPKASLSPSSELAQLSLAELSSLFDPSAPSSLSEYPHYSYDSPVPLQFTGSLSPFHQSLENDLRAAQNVICQHILNIENDPSISFRQDSTLRPDGGGIARVLSGGSVFQKAGVSTSVANVRIPFSNLRYMTEDHEELTQLLAENEWKRIHSAASGDKSIQVYDPASIVTRFTASLSLVIHTTNPLVPTVHANYRYFEFNFPDGRQIWWYGGGSDLTPAYVNEKDAKHFHSILKTACDNHGTDYYSKYKQWCDKYFLIKHRGETRGVGGIFFDDLHSQSKEHYHSFIRSLASHFSQSYFPLVLSHHTESFTAAQLRWQQMRRSRYVEFNLMYDKGTSFGLAQPNARVEAILMSLPLTCRFEYKPTVEKGSQEEYTLNVLKQPREWL